MKSELGIMAAIDTIDSRPEVTPESLAYEETGISPVFSGGVLMSKGAPIITKTNTGEINLGDKITGLEKELYSKETTAFDNSEYTFGGVKVSVLRNVLLLVVLLVVIYLGYKKIK